LADILHQPLTGLGLTIVQLRGRSHRRQRTPRPRRCSAAPNQQRYNVVSYAAAVTATSSHQFLRDPWVPAVLAKLLGCMHGPRFWTDYGVGFQDIVHASHTAQSLSYNPIHASAGRNSDLAVPRASRQSSLVGKTLPRAPCSKTTVRFRRKRAFCVLRRLLCYPYCVLCRPSPLWLVPSSDTCVYTCIYDSSGCIVASCPTTAHGPRGLHFSTCSAVGSTTQPTGAVTFWMRVCC
jgi:hypothetical protein